MPETAATPAPEIKKIFISHVALDAHIALLLKKQIERAFKDQLEAFVSAAGGPLGTFTDAIAKELRSADMLIVLATRFAVGSTWVSFEAGFAKALDITTVPVYDPPVTAAQLPPSLSQLEARRLNERTFSKQLIKNDLAPTLGLKVRHGFSYLRMQKAIRAERGRKRLMTDVLEFIAKQDSADPKPPNTATTIDSLAKVIDVSPEDAVDIVDSLETGDYVASGYDRKSRRSAYKLTKRGRSILELL